MTKRRKSARRTAGTRTLWALLAAFVVLAGLTIYQSQQLIQQTVTLPPSTLSPVFPDLAVGQIQGVRLRDEDNDMRLTIARDDQGAWVAIDAEGTLDQEAALSIAQTLVLMPYQRTLPAPEDGDLRAYGFRPNGVLFVDILLADGSAHVLAVGELSPAATSYFALVDDQPQIYVLERGAIDYLISQLRTPPVT